MSRLIEKNFILEETNLWRCKECGGTYENENECLNHLKDSDLDEEDYCEYNIKRLERVFTSEINIGIDDANPKRVWNGVDKLLTLKRKELIKLIKNKAKLKYGLKGFLEDLDAIAGDKLV